MLESRCLIVPGLGIRSGVVLPTVFSSGWASGVSAYLAVLQLGVLGRFFGADSVPDALTRTDVMVAAAVLYAIEFVTDKIPYLDNAWDAIHTVIRPTIGAVLGLLVAGDADTLGQAVAATAGGLTALASHLCKAAARLVINISPEPVTTSPRASEKTWPSGRSSRSLSSRPGRLPPLPPCSSPRASTWSGAFTGRSAERSHAFVPIACVRTETAEWSLRAP